MPLTALRQTPQPSIRVDADAGILYDVAFITAGDTRGHGFIVDQVMLSQVVNAINDRGRIPVRFKHPVGPDGRPNPTSDHLQALVGHAFNARLVGNQVRGDIQLGAFAKVSPSGNLFDFLIALAQTAPADIGLSIIFHEGAFEPTPAGLAGRVKSIRAIDFTDSPAANPRGLLSQGAAMPPETSPTSSTHSTPATAAASPTPTIDAAAVALSTPPASSATTLHTPEAIALQARVREQGIIALSQQYQLGDRWAAAQLSNPTRTVEQCAEIARELSAFRQSHQPIALGGPDSGPHGLGFTAGEDSRDSLEAAMSDAIALSHGVNIAKPHPRARKFRGLSIMEMARTWLNEVGISTDGMSRGQIAQTVFSPRELSRRGLGGVMLSHTTSDFPNIVAAGIRSKLRAGYEETPVTWNRWAKRTTAPDFETIERVSKGMFPTPARVNEGAEYTYATIGDLKQTYRLIKYGKIFSLTWETLLADRLGAFMDLARNFVATCRRLEDDNAYNSLTSNPVMQEDNVTLFHTATHGNLASPGAAPSVAALSAARVALALQTGPGTDGAVLNLPARHVLCPVALQDTVEQLINSTIDPAATNDAERPRFIASLDVTADPRLDADSANDWYVLAPHTAIDTVEVCFLESEPTPVLLESERFNTDAREYKIRHSVAACCVDWRGVYKNQGGS